MSDFNEMLGKREKRYGRFADHAAISTTLKNFLRAALLAAKSNPMCPDQAEALDMICHEIGGIVAGDPRCEDSWRDIAAYATLVADRLLEEQKTDG